MIDFISISDRMKTSVVDPVPLTKTDPCSYHVKYNFNADSKCSIEISVE